MAQRIGALRLWNRFLSTSASTASCTPSVAAGSSAEIGVQEFLKSVGKGVEAHAEKVANESGSFSDFLQLRSGRLKLDEDVFMEELLLKEEEAQDTGVEAIRTRLAKWKRPNVQRYHNAYDSIEKVSARVSNIPKFMFKSDLLWFLKGCNLRPEDLIIMYDTKYRSKYVQVNFSSVESFRLAQRTLSMKGRLGGRYLKLTQEEPQMDDINVVLQQFRGRSLLMLKVHISAATEDVERFFAGYILDTNHPVKFLRSMIQGSSGGRRPSAVAAKPEFELKALVRFKTEAEAFRALREKQGSYCLEKSVDLRFIE